MNSLSPCPRLSLLPRALKILCCHPGSRLYLSLSATRWLLCLPHVHNAESRLRPTVLDATTGMVIF